MALFNYCRTCGRELTEKEDNAIAGYCEEHDAEEWNCPNCGSEDPHHATTFYDEIEVDVTCESVYITPIDGGNGFAFDHEDFEEIINHYQLRNEGSE